MHLHSQRAGSVPFCGFPVTVCNATRSRTLAQLLGTFRIRQPDLLCVVSDEYVVMCIPELRSVCPQRTPLPGSASLRAALAAASSWSPLVCQVSAARSLQLQSSVLQDHRSLSGLLNPEEPPELMVTPCLLAHMLADHC